MKLNVITSNGLEGQAICKLIGLPKYVTSLVYIPVSHFEKILSKFFACLRVRYGFRQFHSSKLRFRTSCAISKIF